MIAHFSDTYSWAVNNKSVTACSPTFVALGGFQWHLGGLDLALIIIVYQP